MTKETKMYVGIGVTAIIIYLIWKNRSQFGGAVDVQTPIGGVSAQAGGGEIRLGVNAPAPMVATDMTAMNSGMVLPDGTLVGQAV